MTFTNILQKKKLILSFSLIILIFFILGITTINGLLSQSNFTKKIYNTPFSISIASFNITLELNKMRQSMRDMVIANSGASIDKRADQLKKNQKNVSQLLSTIRDKKTCEKTQILAREIRELFDASKVIRTEVFKLLKDGNRAGAIKVLTVKGATHINKLEEKALELVAYAKEQAGKFLIQSESNQKQMAYMTILFTVSGVILSFLIAYMAISMVIQTENKLHQKNTKLKEAYDEISTLRGIIPICASCKKIRDDKGYWNQIESYIKEHSEAEFSHSICPDCLKKLYPDFRGIKKGDKPSP